jgi:phosphatidylserine/phosphatidylglycerophosphate/cardiolipin synthase-like enzyme
MTVPSASVRTKGQGWRLPQALAVLHRIPSRQLSWGPSLDFHLFNTSDTFSRLVTLIREAKERVTLISPYVTLATDDQVGRAIREALSRKVKVALVFRRDEHTPLKEDWLESMRPHVDAGLGLFCLEGLHAKIYKSESTVLVTSLNLLGSSVLKSIEAGLWSQDPKAVAEVDAFIRREIQPHVQQLSFSGKAKKPSTPEKRIRSNSPSPRKEEGYCIRCGDGIALNARRPYCRDDFDEWAEWENEDFKDNYCHGCGRGHPATMRKPLCLDCFRADA